MILDFWFGATGSVERGHSRAIWFKKDAAFDALLRERFGALHAQAAAGQLSVWGDGDAESRLALIVVLDQFSRNLHRGDPASFASDGAALRLAKDMVADGEDAALLPVMRSFVYLPFEHSEQLPDQDEAVRLFTLLETEPATKGLAEWAHKHREIIVRFGRFPHRNAILGRASTPAEMAFLAQPGSSF
jgi:uncharacterized protein (DUF924 family)